MSKPPRRNHASAFKAKVALAAVRCRKAALAVAQVRRGVPLHAYASVSAATAGIARYFTHYNSRRPHSSLTDRTPDDAYCCPLPLQAAAGIPLARQFTNSVRLYKKAEPFQGA